MVENIYKGIDFYGEFKKGDSAVYDEYKKKYAEFLSGQSSLWDEEGDKYNSLEDYLKNYLDFHINYLEDYIDISNKFLEDYSLEEYLRAKTIRFYYFDMDEDNLPELCMEGKMGMFIFKYNSDTDQFGILWESWPGYDISGSRKIRYTDKLVYMPLYEFIELNRNGAMVFRVEFGVREPETCNQI